MIYVGIDDTDSMKGMCTTFIALEGIKRLSKLGIYPTNFPRLVRLNPNIPWKTRGNGAVSILFAKNDTKRVLIGRCENKNIFTTDDSSEDVMEEIFDIFGEIIEEFSIREDPSTSPGLIVSKLSPPEEFYWKAVRGIVELNTVKKWITKQKNDVLYREINGGRGLIGALAAIAWRPNDKTFELLTYKRRNDWLKRPNFDKNSVKLLDKSLRCTFDNFDYVQDCACIFPRALTPVLYGVRGDCYEELYKALKIVKTDLPIYGWLIFETNQGTDDHIVEKTIKEIKRFESVLIKGEVISKPKIIEGGHVVFKISDGTGEIWCAAYEPTKGFRKIILELNPGDIIKVWGSIKEYKETINIEKIEIIQVKDIVKERPPICPKCGKRMTSLGKNKGFKCKKCGLRLPEERKEMEIIKRYLKPGLYEVPPVARRHLSKPIKRIKQRCSCGQ